MKKILITGTSNGIGLSAAKRFLSEGYYVIGFDLEESKIDDKNYKHYQLDIKDANSLPELEDLDYIFHNAGKQNDDDIDNNLKGTINVNEKYMNLPSLKAILFNASASARSGFEFPMYVASKAGLVGYMKNVASRLANRGICVNSISLGGVITSSNDPVINDKKLFSKIMDSTPLKKWMSLEEVDEWVYFLLTKNKSMSGQDILIDNGENDLNNTFVWPSK